jgi:hypothetical protein
MRKHEIIAVEDVQMRGRARDVNTYVDDPNVTRVGAAGLEEQARFERGERHRHVGTYCRSAHLAGRTVDARRYVDCERRE